MYSSLSDLGSGAFSFALYSSKFSKIYFPIASKSAEGVPPKSPQRASKHSINSKPF